MSRDRNGLAEFLKTGLQNLSVYVGGHIRSGVLQSIQSFFCYVFQEERGTLLKKSPREEREKRGNMSKT